MKFEIVEFYPDIKEFKNSIRIGTFHVYIHDKDIDLRGINCYLNSTKKLHFKLPHRSGKDPESGNQVNYPIVNFIKDEDFKDFKEFLSSEGTRFINEHHKDVLRVVNDIARKNNKRQ